MSGATDWRGDYLLSADDDAIVTARLLRDCAAACDPGLEVFERECPNGLPVRGAIERIRQYILTLDPALGPEDDGPRGFATWLVYTLLDSVECPRTLATLLEGLPVALDADGDTRGDIYDYRDDAAVFALVSRRGLTITRNGLVL